MAVICYAVMCEVIHRGDVRYEIKPFTEWENVAADFVISDPPFGIDFSGKETNYNRDKSNVVDGYVEWEVSEYADRISNLLDTINESLVPDGTALVFSGMDNSHIIQQEIINSNLTFEGKLYWSYNFAPYCSRRPAHNVYEIFWVTNEERWYYDNECGYDHCTNGEANLSLIDVNREYHTDMPKYPTSTPSKLFRILYDHFTESGDTIFNPCAGSGMSGVVADEMDRSAILGDINAETLDIFEEIYDMYQQ